jgi:hypothetical protein
LIFLFFIHPLTAMTDVLSVLLFLLIVLLVIHFAFWLGSTDPIQDGRFHWNQQGSECILFKSRGIDETTCTVDVTLHGPVVAPTFLPPFRRSSPRAVAVGDIEFKEGSGTAMLQFDATFSGCSASRPKFFYHYSDTLMGGSAPNYYTSGELNSTFRVNLGASRQVGKYDYVVQVWKTNEAAIVKLDEKTIRGSFSVVAKTIPAPVISIAPIKTVAPVIAPIKTVAPVIAPTKTVAPVIAPTKTVAPVIAPTKTVSPVIAPTFATIFIKHDSYKYVFDTIKLNQALRDGYITTGNVKTIIHKHSFAQEGIPINKQTGEVTNFGIHSSSSYYINLLANASNTGFVNKIKI